MADSKARWIQGAVKREGALTAKAKRACKSITEYCAMGGHDELTQKQCNLAKTFRSFKK